LGFTQRKRHDAGAQRFIGGKIVEVDRIGVERQPSTHWIDASCAQQIRRIMSDTDIGANREVGGLWRRERKNAGGAADVERNDPLSAQFRDIAGNDDITPRRWQY